MPDKTKSLTIEQKYRLAEEIIQFLYENECFNDIALYVNGFCFTSYPRPCYLKIIRPYGTYYKSIDKVDIVQQLAYANPDLLTMTFEGDFNHIINHRGFDEDPEYSEKILEKFSTILDKYGLYYEQGYSWSLACYYKD